MMSATDRRALRPSTAAIACAAACVLFAAASGPARADNAGPANVTPVDNSGVQIHTTILPPQPAASTGTGGSVNAAANPRCIGWHGSATTYVPPAANTAPGQVVVGGKVPDEATKAAVLQRLRDTYGANNVSIRSRWATSPRRPTGAPTCRS